MERILDLHMHTTMSDGALTPKEIVDEAIKNNVSIMSITDHDTLEAYTDEIIKYIEDNNIKLIKGIEISTKTSKSGIHVLGYNIDINNKELNDKLYRLRNARHVYLHDVSEKLKDLGYKINTKKLDKVDAVTKAHIALDVVENKENEKLLIDNFGHIPNKGEFIETIMNEGCPAYTPKETISPKEAAELIRKAGGVPVLAHPVAYKYEDNLTDEEILDIVKDMKAPAIEANYLYVDRNDNKIDEVEKWNKFAKDNNLFTTIGSDFHNKDGLRPEVGFLNWPLKLPEEKIDEMMENLFKDVD